MVKICHVGYVTQSNIIHGTICFKITKLQIIYIYIYIFININFIYFTRITTKETISYIEFFVGPDGGVSVVLEGGGNRSARGKPP